MSAKQKYIAKMIILFVEVLSNVISLYILPLPNKFKKDHLSKLIDYDNNINFSYIESKLSSPRKTVIAIMVFGCVLGIVHIIKIIIFICHRDSFDDINDNSKIIDIFDICLLFINWGMSISIIPKLDKVRGGEFDYRITDDIRNNILKIFFLYSFCYVYIIIQYYIKDKSEYTIEEKPRNTVALKINNNNNNIATTSRRNIETYTETNSITTNRIILLSNILPEQVYRNIKSFIELG